MYICVYIYVCLGFTSIWLVAYTIPRWEEVVASEVRSLYIYRDIDISVYRATVYAYSYC